MAGWTLIVREATADDLDALGKLRTEFVEFHSIREGESADLFRGKRGFRPFLERRATRI